MSKVLAMRGVSGSGKSTYAEELRRDGWSVVSRDAIREAVFKDYSDVDENAVTEIQDAMVEALLKAGRRVVIDDTNIRLNYLKRFAAMAAKHNASFDVKQFDVELSTAIVRVKARAGRGGRDVPESVIRKQFQGLKSAKFNLNDLYVTDELFRPYVKPEHGDPAILVDIDGTLAHNDGHRGWYDYSLVGNDKVKTEIALIVSMYYSAGFTVVVMSGRDDSCEDATIDWLDFNGIPWDEIFMRKTGDMRKDNIVKAELFDAHVRDVYDVEVVLDDRNQVVEMWRSLGLTCLQVAPGNF